VARKLAPPGWTVEAPDEALVEAEPDLVELALRNLVENAAKYAPDGARTVRVAREDDRVRVGVIDEGPGVPEKARAQMFERYWRDAKDGAGRGLGLALVRAVAERSGGRADARAGSKGAGLDVGFSMGPVLGWSDA
jgi:signal transduction histidine kinase